MIDAHVHLFDDSLFTYSWSPGHRRALLRARPVPQGVAGEKFVVVEGGVIARQGKRESEWLSTRARRTARIAGVVVRASRTTGTSARQPASSRLALTAGLSPGRIRAVMLSVASDCISLDVLPQPGQLGTLSQVLTRIRPSFPIVIDHLGQPPMTARLSSSQGREWRAALAALSRNTQVNVKLSGFANAGMNTGARARRRDYLLATVDLFGPTRTPFGSDWPVTSWGNAAMSRNTWRHAVVDALDLDEAETVQVMGDSARRIYRTIGDQT